MFAKLDRSIVDLLCCPLCKSALREGTGFFQCTSCGLVFLEQKVQVGRDSYDSVYDFRIHHPSYVTPPTTKQWMDIQGEYEKFHKEFGDRDASAEYLGEIESVREIYTKEYSITGNVLDVGGHQGRLRHYLTHDVSLYVSIDPHLNIFERMDKQPNLLKAYPCLREPCNFLAAHAEFLPFKAKSFDWVHMRSVVDHFSDPFLAFLEAFRVCKTSGKLMVGLAIMEKVGSSQTSCPPPPTPEKEPERKNKSRFAIFSALKERAARRMPWSCPRGQVYPDRPKGEVEAGVSVDRDEHIYRLSHAELLDLHEKTNWTIIKEHWQKPPFDFCIYTCAEARGLVSNEP